MSLLALSPHPAGSARSATVALESPRPDQGIEIQGRSERRDLVVMGLATQHLSRLITKDSVLSPVRKPFLALAQVSDYLQLAYGALRKLG